MQEALIAYHSTLLAATVLAGLVVLQILIADVAGMRVKHVPGMPVIEGHASFHFRAVRAIGNTNEGLGLTLLLLALALALGASPPWVNGLAWAYVAGRAGHMTFYYAKVGWARSTAFSIGLAAQVGLLIAVAATLL
jgi:uncharacterized MAPEG superfamily protein